jgi:hypothetical protein
MRDETVDFVETAHCGDALPTLIGAEFPRGFEVLAVIRTQDQIRIRCRRRAGSIDSILAARAAARILAYRSADPEPA